MVDKLMSLSMLAAVTLLFPVIWAVTSRDAGQADNGPQDGPPAA
ncbi:hypothetical protein [Azospirillum halopraeferens]|nr:hypothetical protein [Azospirillum halopraeferens]